jgi:septal ring factor EnvC (AmiA/AmiB activator)
VKAELAESLEAATSTQRTLEADVSSLRTDLTSSQQLTDSLQKDLATASKSMQTALARATVRGAFHPLVERETSGREWIGSSSCPAS